MITDGQTMVIDRFHGEHEYLSNFSDHPAEYTEVWFPTAEHAFAAAKTTEPRWVQRIEAAATPGAAKKLGRQLPLRPDWDQIKPTVMAEILRSKFTRDPRLRDLLVSTGDQLLIEGNDWNDDYWGRCLRPGLVTPAGTNMLGRTLMQVRAELRGDPADRWPRVALTGHREHLISPEAHPWVRAELERVAIKLRDQHGTHTASTGLATGADTWWAEAAFAAGLDVWGYQPFPTQSERWTETQQADHTSICERLTRLVLVADHADSRFFGARNQLLLGDAQAVVAVRDPRITRGGTVSALHRYCSGMPVITVDIVHRRTTIAAVYCP
ncbi:NADAR family protein [Nocardia sp. NPDC047038]|uniref:NADAR family protein n=1 Tax=Nocardia sp. NPDC047038 TaxID=3154338 RepID=UPI003410BCB1